MKRYIKSSTDLDLDEKLAKSSKDPQELEALFDQYYDPSVKFMVGSFYLLRNLARNPYTPAHILEKLYFDPDRPLFKNHVAINPNVPESVIQDILEKDDITALGNLAHNRACPKDLLQDLFDRAISEEDHFLLAGLANNSKLTPEMFDTLEAFILDPAHIKKNYAYDVIRGLNKNSGFRKNHDKLPLK